MTKNIIQHEGSKYLRTINSSVNNTSIQTDVYAVLEAFNVTCPAIAHCIKKLLCCGIRGKGDKMADLIGAEAALSRAIELQKQREQQKKDMVAPNNTNCLKCKSPVLVGSSCNVCGELCLVRH